MSAIDRAGGSRRWSRRCYVAEKLVKIILDTERTIEKRNMTFEVLKILIDQTPNWARELIKFQDEEDEETDTSKILFYDQNEEYKGIKYLKPLYLAIQKKQVLQITYKGFQDKTATTYEFHPHILKQYNRRWFVFGLNNTNGNSEWSIPLDERLISFSIIEDLDYKDSENDWDSFFRTMVGVVRPTNSQIEKVVLRFYNGRENYFKTKPFHPDYDEFLEEDKQDQVWFETIVNKELVQQILSYGKDVQVIEPILY